MIRFILCVLALFILSLSITLTMSFYGYSPGSYLLTNMIVGGILGYISHKAGYNV